MLTYRKHRVFGGKDSLTNQTCQPITPATIIIWGRQNLHPMSFPTSVRRLVTGSGELRCSYHGRPSMIHKPKFVSLCYPLRTAGVFFFIVGRRAGRYHGGATRRRRPQHAPSGRTHRKAAHQCATPTPKTTKDKTESPVLQKPYLLWRRQSTTTSAVAAVWCHYYYGCGCCSVAGQTQTSLVMPRRTRPGNGRVGRRVETRVLNCEYGLAHSRARERVVVVSVVASHCADRIFPAIP
jgi:hypothetical protein